MTAEPIGDAALAEVVRLAEGATPGPWHRNIRPASRYPVIFAGRNTHVAQVVAHGLPEEQVEANCDFLAAANPGTVQAMRARIAEEKAAARGWKNIAEAKQRQIGEMVCEARVHEARAVAAEAERDRLRAALEDDALVQRVAVALCEANGEDPYDEVVFLGETKRTVRWTRYVDNARAALAGADR